MKYCFNTLELWNIPIENKLSICYTINNYGNTILNIKGEHINGKLQAGVY